MSTEFYLPQIPQAAIIPRSQAGNMQPESGKRHANPSPYSLVIHEPVFSPWCASIWKRIFDLACVAPALLLLSPLLGLVAIAVRLTSSGPIIFRQQRTGRDRKLFTIYKFRTMVENSENIGPRHTAKGDPRITSIGNCLRRFKIDELPQLYNVLRGEMSLVGPRPKLPEHEHTNMVCRPGVTGAATLAFRDEQRILCEVPAERLEYFYQNHVIPKKIALDNEYMQNASFVSDLRVVLETIFRRGEYLTHRDLVTRSTRPLVFERPHIDFATEATGD